jgi:uncharacterized FAD-dependent dehydrogenase
MHELAVLVSQRFTEPFRDPITYGRSIAKLANLLGDGIWCSVSPT